MKSVASNPRSSKNIKNIQRTKKILLKLYRPLFTFIIRFSCTRRVIVKRSRQFYDRRMYTNHGPTLKEKKLKFKLNFWARFRKCRFMEKGEAGWCSCQKQKELISLSETMVVKWISRCLCINHGNRIKRVFFDFFCIVLIVYNFFYLNIILWIEHNYARAFPENGATM